MLLFFLYAGLIALILWSVLYIPFRIIRAFRRKGGCSCSGGCRHTCRECGKQDPSEK